MVVAYYFHFIGICIEHTVVVGLAIFREDFVKLFRWLIAISGACLLCHLDATVGHEGTFQRLVGLQTYYLFEVFKTFVDVSWSVSSGT